MTKTKLMPKEFSAYLASTTARVNYLYSDEVKLTQEAEGILISASAETEEETESILKDVSYLFYREKILSETKEIRAALWDK